jgi:glutathione synthase/RimK-type ligase-like ATP-grasp enzyme
MRPDLRIINDASIIQWNMDKAKYLTDLEKAEFLISRFKSVHDLNELSTVEDLASQFSKLAATITGGPVVLKPSFSGSAKQTHLLQSPSRPTPVDIEFFNTITTNGVDGSLLIQAYEPAISKGEYAIIIIARKHTHTILKTLAKGEFRCQAEFDGDTKEIPLAQVPAQAVKTAESIMSYLDVTVGKATYCRIDGVIRDSGEFVLMEVEAIEPHLWLETCEDERNPDALYDAILGGISGDAERGGFASSRTSFLSVFTKRDI